MIFLTTITVLSILIASGSTIYQENIIDVRSTCLANSLRNIFLPSDEDTSVNVYISPKKYKPVCGFNIISLLKDVGFIVVIQFLGEKLQCNPGDIIVKDEIVEDVCQNQYNLRDDIFQVKRISKNVTVLFNISTSNNLDLKLTVTAANLLLNSELSQCEEMGKISCQVGNNTVCIEKKLRCNGDFNCGAKDRFDEDAEICKVLGWKRWLVVICTILLALFISLKIIHFINNNITKSEDYFFVVDDNDDTINYKKNTSLVLHNQAPQQISLTKELYKKQSSFLDSLEVNVTEQSLNVNSSSTSPALDWTQPSDTISKEIEVKSNKPVGNWPPNVRRPSMHLHKNISHKMSTNEETNSYGIKVTYYDM